MRPRTLDELNQIARERGYSPGPVLAKKIMAAREARARAKAATPRICLSCGASVTVQADGTIPEGGMPCGH